MPRPSKTGEFIMYAANAIRRAGRRALLAGTIVIIVSSSGVAVAKAPEPSDEKGIPQYMAAEFEAVRTMLEENAQALAELKLQLEAVESSLQTEIHLARDDVRAEIESRTDSLSAQLDLLGTDVVDVLAILNEPEKDIQLTTELCFDLGASWDWAYTGKLELGLEADVGLSGGAKVEVSTPGVVPVMIIPPFTTPIPMIPAVSSGIGNTVCLTVPLYAVASNEPWITDLDTDSFDDLVSAIASPAQNLMPMLADGFGQIFPKPSSSMTMVSNGLQLFDAGSAANAGLESNGHGLQKSVRSAGYLSADPAVHLAAADSFEDMILDSPLLGLIMEGPDAGTVFGDPCGIAGELSRNVCAALKTYVDPLCLMDPLRLTYCK